MKHQGLRALGRAAALLAALTLSQTASAQEILLGSLLPLTGPAAPVGIEE